MTTRGIAPTTLCVEAPMPLNALAGRAINAAIEIVAGLVLLIAALALVVPQ